MSKTTRVLAISLVALASSVPAASVVVLKWDAIDGPLALPWQFLVWTSLYTLFMIGFVSALVRASDPRKTKPAPLDRPHWRTSHRAVAPNGSLVAEISEAREHSMSNPTIGTLRLSDGLELHRCSPAFLWSDDSRYLAVPRWHSLRQRLVIVDVEHRTIHTSPFGAALLLPKTFERGSLEVLSSHSAGMHFGWKKKPLIVKVPQDLIAFAKNGYD